MKKTTILTVGAVTLAMGLGLTAMNAAGLLASPISPQADENVKITYCRVVSTTPADGAELPLWQGLSQVMVSFTDASESNEANFDGVVVNTEATENITLANEAGDVVASINPQDAALVGVDARMTNNVYVNIPSDVTLKAGKYTFTLPAGTFKKDANGSSMSEDGGEETPVIQLTPKVEINFTMVETPQWTTTPVSGQTVSTYAGGLDEAKIEFEGGTISVGSGDINLYLMNPAGSTAEAMQVLVGTYEPAISGSTVNLTLKLAEDQSVEDTKSPKYYEIQVPEGAFNIVYNGSSSKSLPINITNLGVAFFDQSMIELADEPGQFTPATAPKEIIMNLPFKMTVNNKKAYLKFNGSDNVAQYTASLMPNGTTVIWEMDAPTSNTSSTGNPQYWQSGDYTFQVLASTFTVNVTVNGKAQTKGNAVMNFSGWKMVDGITSMPVVAESINPIVSSETIAEANFGDISAKTGVQTMRVQFLQSMKVNPNNLTAKVALYKDGDENPLWEQVNDGNPNHDHVWNGKPAKTMASKTGTAWTFTYESCTADNNYGKDANNNLIAEYLKTPGSYTLKIDKGFFVKSSGTAFENDDVELKFTINPEVTYTVNPASQSSVSKITEITFSYPEGIVAEVPENTTVEMWLSPQEMQRKPSATFNVEANGNVVTLKLPEAWTTPSQTGYDVIVPTGAWKLKVGSNEYANEGVTLHYSLNVVGKGEVTPAPTAEGETISIDDLKEIVYTPLTTVKAVNGKATLYKLVETDGTATREEVATYSAPAIGEDDAAVSEVKWTADSDLSSLTAGTYEFVIPTGALTYSLNLLPEEDFVYTYNVVPVESTGVANVGLGASDSFDVYTLDGRVVKLGASAADVLTLEPGLYIVNGQKVLIKK